MHAKNHLGRQGLTQKSLRPSLAIVQFNKTLLKCISNSSQFSVNYKNYPFFHIIHIHIIFLFQQATAKLRGYSVSYQLTGRKCNLNFRQLKSLIECTVASIR